MTVDAKYRITITDLNSGELIHADGLCSRIETSFAVVCDLVHSDDGGSAFAHGLIGSKFTFREFHGMMLTVLQCLGRAAHTAAADPAEYDHLVSAITGAFQRWLEDELGKPGAALMLYGMSLLAEGVDPVPEEGEL